VLGTAGAPGTEGALGTCGTAGAFGTCGAAGAEGVAGSCGAATGLHVAAGVTAGDDVAAFATPGTSTAPSKAALMTAEILRIENSFTHHCVGGQINP
jgi:hypothetical protein